MCTDRAFPGPRVRRALTLARAGLVLSAWLAIAIPASAQQAPMRADVSVSTTGGFARIVITTPEDIEPQVRLANGIVVVAFKQPVEVPVERLVAQAREYVSGARADPDRAGFRIALARRLRINSMAAGEKLFIDLLPESWTGLPPPLPNEVVEELARRAREAERRQRRDELLAQQRRRAPMRLRIVEAPTFHRYVFDLSEPTAVSTDRTGDRITLTFDAPLRIDLAETRANLPTSLRAIDAEEDGERLVVRMTIPPRLDLRTFREDDDYIVDVVFEQPRPVAPRADGLPVATPQQAARSSGAGETTPQPRPRPAAPPSTVPAAAAPAASSPPAAPPPAAPVTPAVAPPPPVTVAQPPPATPPDTAAQAREVPAAAPAAPQAAPAPVPASSPVVAAAPAPPVETPVRPAAPSSPPQPVEAPALPPAPAPTPAIVPELRRVGDEIRLRFPFETDTSAAIFRRGDVLWLVFDTDVPIDVERLAASSHGNIRVAESFPSGQGRVVRLTLDRGRLTASAAEGAVWLVTIAERLMAPALPLMLNRIVTTNGRAAVAAGFEGVGRVHHLSDPDTDDTLIVATGRAPARGLPTVQDFVEFRALASPHGLAIQPVADDLMMVADENRVVINRPAGLALSSAAPSASRRIGAGRPSGTFDGASWGSDRDAEFAPRRNRLVQAVSDAPEGGRTAARIDLARFFLARNLVPEAMGVIDFALSEDPRVNDDPVVRGLRATTLVLLGRNEDALQEINHNALTGVPEMRLWRGVVESRLGRHAAARDSFRSSEPALVTLPSDLQRVVLAEAIKTSLALGDTPEASRFLNDLDTLGVPPDDADEIGVLAGRVAESTGRTAEATEFYRAVSQGEGPAAAEARLRLLAMRVEAGQIEKAAAIAEAERLQTRWRGDDIEAGAIELLTSLYLDTGRWRDAFTLGRVAILEYPRNEATRRAHDRVARAFETLFLEGNDDSLSLLDALALYYDYRDLTPVGRRGDEMIRRLADRLVAVDLLDQAAVLLQHQIDNRLTGAARAQVATRLAYIHLLARAPDRAIGVLRATRAAELPQDLRNARTLLEAYALAETGRSENAVELTAAVPGAESLRLRGEIHWRARNWRQSAEAYEAALGSRHSDNRPLSDVERQDILRAAVGYGLAEDGLSLGRLKSRYAALMAETPDAASFATASAAVPGQGADFRALARAITTTGSLDRFLVEFGMRFQEPRTPATQPAAPPPSASPAAERATPAPRPAT